MTTANARGNAEARAHLVTVLSTFKAELIELVAKHNVSPLFTNVPPVILADHMLKAAALFAQTVINTEAYYAQAEAGKTQSAIIVPQAIVAADGGPL